MKLFDGHCDTILGLMGNPKSGPLPVGSLFENQLQVDLKRGLEMEAYAQTFALFGFREMCYSSIFDTLYDRFVSEADACSEHLCFCRSRSEALNAAEAGKAAAFLSIEGAEVIGCDPSKLEEAAAKACADSASPGTGPTRSPAPTPRSRIGASVPRARTW